MAEEFPCRTKMVSGTTYRIKLLDAEGSERMSTSYDDEERAKSYIQRMLAILNKDGKGFSFEISEHPWTQEVCIECGREVW